MVSLSFSFFSFLLLHISLFFLSFLIIFFLCALSHPRAYQVDHLCSPTRYARQDEIKKPTSSAAVISVSGSCLAGSAIGRSASISWDMVLSFLAISRLFEEMVKKSVCRMNFQLAFLQAEFTCRKVVIARGKRQSERKHIRPQACGLSSMRDESSSCLS